MIENIHETKNNIMKIYYTETEGGRFRRLLEKDICLVVIADDQNKIVANYDAIIM